jgi:hypothetical protein
MVGARPASPRVTFRQGTGFTCSDINSQVSVATRTGTLWLNDLHA